jgi:hypothetical protein
MRPALLSALLFIAGVCLSVVARADMPCPDLAPDNGPLGFRRRTHGDRCEGFYKGNVSGEALSVAYLMSGRLPAGSEVEVRSVASNLEINVRAIALPLGTYYRMEGIVGPKTILRWPLSEVVQASQNLKGTDLGLYGWFGNAARSIDRAEPARRLCRPRRRMVRADRRWQREQRCAGRRFPFRGRFLAHRRGEGLGLAV